MAVVAGGRQMHLVKRSSSQAWIPAIGVCREAASYLLVCIPQRMSSVHAIVCGLFAIDSRLEEPAPGAGVSHLDFWTLRLIDV